MLGQYATSQALNVDNRIFVYEVAGLSVNESTVGNQAPIRSSDNQLIQVPFHRMGEVMQWINLMGGEIVSIRPIKDIKDKGSVKQTLGSLYSRQSSYPPKNKF